MFPAPAEDKEGGQRSMHPGESLTRGPCPWAIFDEPGDKGERGRTWQARQVAWRAMAREKAEMGWERTGSGVRKGGSPHSRPFWTRLCGGVG